MATVEVAVRDLERRTLPPLCVKTGLPAEVGVAKTFVWVPGWTWILILFGIFPFLIARYFAARRVTLELPATAQVDKMRRNAGMATILVCALAIALLVYSSWQQFSTLYWLVGALLLGALIYRTTEHYAHWVGGYLQEETLVLSRVHPRFVDACQRDFAGV
jgi:predicted lysophospholipase L1 biosynthesis ABC-type transport system permease subunit